MADSPILTKVDDRGVASITLNRPHVFNGYNENLLTELTKNILKLESNERVRVITLRGAGKHFSAGADVNWFEQLAKANFDERMAAARLSTNAMRALDECSKPTVAVVHGACYGGGVGYVAACDIVVASEESRFAVTEVRLGITPAPIISQLTRALGVRRARRYLISGETFDVTEAKAIGLVSEICPANEHDYALQPILDGLLSGGPAAISKTKSLVRRVGNLDMSQELADELAGISATGRGTDEGVEGFSAFLEKRQPSWKK